MLMSQDADPLSNNSGGSLSTNLRHWLSGRGSWGRIELEVCEIIAAGSVRAMATQCPVFLLLLSVWL